MTLSTKSIFIGICVLITISSIIATATLTVSTTAAEAGNFISYQLLKSSNPTLEQLFGKNQINMILEQANCEGVRIYYDCENIFVIGTDANGNDLKGRILSFGLERVGENIIEAY